MLRPMYLMEVGLLGFEEFHALVQGLLPETFLARQLEGQGMLQEHRKHLRWVKSGLIEAEQACG